MSETGGSELNWTWWLGIALVLAIARFVYAYFFGEPWVPPADARFADDKASVFIKRPFNRKFSWGTVVWVTESELHAGALDEPVPLSGIRSIRETKWYRRSDPVIEVVYERLNQRETIQLAVRDWQKLKLLLGSNLRETKEET